MDLAMPMYVLYSSSYTLYTHKNMERKPTRDKRLTYVQKATNAQSTIGGFLALQEQKGAAEGNYQQHAENMNLSDDPTALKGTCETEDHSFMGHRPGHSHTLPGWSLSKEAVEATYVSFFPFLPLFSLNFVNDGWDDADDDDNW